MTKPTFVVGEQRYVIDTLLRHAKSGPEITLNASEFHTLPGQEAELKLGTPAIPNAEYPQGFKPEAGLVVFLKVHGKHVIVYGRENVAQALSEGKNAFQGFLITKHGLKHAEYIDERELTEPRPYQDHLASRLDSRGDVRSYGSMFQDRAPRHDYGRR